MTIENLNDEETLALLSYYVKTKDLAKALELCQERPYELISISFIHAAILCQIGLYERAIVLYCKVLEVEPNNDLCKFQLGVAQFFSNQNHEAFETWHGLDDFVDFVEAFRSLSEQNLSDAEHRLEAFIAKNKKYPELNDDAENLLVQIRINIGEESTESEVANNSVVSNEVESLLSIYKQ
ncbi:hypothetical protein [Vibrio coralliilyticus]|uniref:Tetratricopeptide repeat protein n=1 Tax=Vibrio coralliilyticus TaxID=190893 RepID=A0AAP6ZRE9_9VIBR|nr:hypothetical protein [Vibrio coralliilyticus]ERB62411.1 hypothetical protein N779_26530 [Vibrio coralliilyticus OCN008]NOJ23552.1 hypothetical protein [Vibrio coralliilyticus]QIJ84729.1 hypothetical protein G3U99_10920 [Vibrio coralliilyticus OCN008]